MIDQNALRLRIYRQLATRGRVSTPAELAAELAEDEQTVRDALRALARDRLIVLDDADTIVLAHPFATRDFGFAVKTGTTLWWGGCAWDSFAIPHLVPDASPALIATTCPACGRAHAWNVSRDAAPAGDQVAHFLVPIPHAWDDVTHTCQNQRIFCDEQCVEVWLARTGNTKGSVFDLGRLWALASDWYTGRLDEHYRRREPSQAAAYFAGVGLTGPFWGN